MTIISAITRHWILNLAWECRREISDVIPFVEEMHLNVSKVPGVTANDYAAALLDLFNSGAIKVRFKDEDGSLANRSDLEAALHTRLLLPPISGRRTHRRDGPPILPPAVIRDAPDLAWELSPLGAEEWESLAQPDWNRFATVLSDPESGEMWSANLDLLMSELGWSRELNGIDIDKATLSLQVLRDFAITYWKVLPVVHHASFKCNWIEHRWTVEGTPDPEWFRMRRTSRFDWYTKPWMLSGWPAAK